MRLNLAEKVDLNGVCVFRAALDEPSQLALVEAVRGIARQAPLFRPVTPRGQPMSVRMTSAGEFGWVTDRNGYRYQAEHPDSGAPWPPIPDPVLDIWRAVSGTERVPESCLVNFYDETARMGLHQDRDEADLTAPVVSVSLGDDARFRVGTTKRGGPTKSLWLASGDIAVLAGEARLAYHGIDKLRPGSSRLLPKGGRINLTLRVVTAQA